MRPVSASSLVATILLRAISRHLAHGLLMLLLHLVLRLKVVPSTDLMKLEAPRLVESHAKVGSPSFQEPRIAKLCSPFGYLGCIILGGVG